ncbi:hypothetical protein NEOLEDRAFT_1080892, partial [Neolentinus lepideus HHB14362 ss-1]
CQTPYNPDRDRQRFCQSCSTWFHVDCMEPLPDYPSEEVVARWATLPIPKLLLESLIV